MTSGTYQLNRECCHESPQSSQSTRSSDFSAFSAPSGVDRRGRFNLAIQGAYAATRTRDLAARAVTCGLFLALTWRMAEDVASTGRITGLLLLVSEFLVVVLTLVRRPALDLNGTWRARAVLVISVVGPALARPDVSAALLPDLLTGGASALGLLVVIGGKLSLGRSFGLLAANRGLVCRGFYRAVRHPIYGGYLITHAAFAAANASPWNLVVLGAADVGLVLRALTEERTLFRDPHYAAYAMTVRWRMVPGLF